VIKDGIIKLIGHAPGAAASGTFAVESMPFNSGASVPKLRKQGAALAKRFGVEFIDKTAN